MIMELMVTLAARKRREKEGWRIRKGKYECYLIIKNINYNYNENDQDWYYEGEGERQTNDDNHLNNENNNTADKDDYHNKNKD